MSPKNAKLIFHCLLLKLLLFVSSHLFALPDDSEQPIYISSNSLLKDDKQGIAIYEGNVNMQQGTLNIKGDKITIYLENEEVTHIIAVGKPATFKQKPELDKGDVEARALTIEYKISRDTIDLKEQAFLNQDGAVTESNKIVYDINAARVEAKGQVNIVLQPQK